MDKMSAIRYAGYGGDSINTSVEVGNIEEVY